RRTSSSTLSGTSLLFASGVGRSANTPRVKTLSCLRFGQLVRSLAADNHCAGHGPEILDFFSKRWGPDGLPAAGEGSLRCTSCESVRTERKRLQKQKAAS